MLKNIKASYFIKLIYKLIDEAQKLKLIRYNKNIQKNLDISIINYKYFKGRYIKYEQNGIGKEYNFYNKLKFEGGYLNGKRNGKGKDYYDDGNIKFEGEYLNGIRHGKGKEYNIIGEIIFKGKYLNGKKWNCKMFGDNNELIFELKNRKGFGQEYSFDCIYKYVGEFFNGEKSGKGKEYENNYPTYFSYSTHKKDIDYELIFKGEYLNGKRNGKGKK